MPSILWLSSLALCPGQSAPPSAQAGDYTIAARGPNSRLWQETVVQTNADGSALTNVQSYIELASGLCYLDPASGKYVDSVEAISMTATGAEAVQGAHQVYWSGNVNTAGGTVQLIAPDGQQFTSQVYGLSYWDTSSGSNVLIAELTNSVGEVVGSNQVTYPDAFDDLKADISYIYTKAGLEQDIILREQPPSPADYGLNPESTRLQVLTAFISPPAPEAIIPGQTDGIAEDQIISFASMYIGMGNAFVVGIDGAVPTAPVSKHWTTLQGKDFLVEEIPFQAISALAAALPAHASLSKPSRRILRSAALQAPPAKNKTRSDPMKVAQFRTKKTPGVLIDYSMVNNGTNLVFQADTTYFVSENVSLYGSNLWEGGTIVKFAPGASITVVPNSVSPQVNFLTGLYRPVVFTAQDDNSVGLVISNSTGNPWTNYYGNPALNLVDLTFCSMTNARFSFASQALKVTAFNPNMRDVQFVNCSNGIEEVASAVLLENTLFANVFSPFNNISSGGIITAENVTFSACPYVVTLGSTNGSSFYFTNCILSQVTNLVGYPASSPSPIAFAFSGNDNGFYNSPEFGTGPVTNASYPFQAAGAGSYYLANGGPFFNAGTTTIDPALLSDIQTRTTYPPVVMTNIWFTNDYTFFPQAQRDTDTPDLGFHYPPLDYAINLCISNATATVLPGTALAVYGSEYGVWLWTNGAFNCTGTATSPNVITRYNTVQEQSNTNWETAAWISSFLFPDQTQTSSASFTFTEWSVLGSDYQLYSYAYSCPLLLQNCQFYGGEIWDVGPTITSSNSLYRRVYLDIRDETSLNDTFCNSLFFDGTVIYNHNGTGIWTFRDNLFDGASVTNVRTATINVCSNNAYVTTNNGVLLPENNDVILSSSPAFEVGTLGEYYYPTTLTNLIHTGSQLASAAGLYHYTVTTNNAIEGTNTVSIGFHYVACSNGVPISTPNDGIPDYLADANGNGVVDSGEISWTNAGDLGLTVIITQPANNSQIP